MGYEQSWPSLHVFLCCIFPLGVDYHLNKASAVFEGNKSIVEVMSI